MKQHDSAAGVDVLAGFTTALATGAIRIVDLTLTLGPDFPSIVMPPEMGQSRPFRMEEISHYDERGGGWYWNNLSFGEHTGTHFDAPIHWVSGRDLPNSSTDTIPVNDLIAPAVVIDCSKESAADADFLLTPDFIKAWEAKHGKIPPRCWVLMRTDWSKKTDPAAYQNFDEVGQHTPGPDPDAVRFLLNERDVLGFGTETIGTDAGQAAHFLPPYPCHYYMHGAGRYGLQCLTNLDLLPPTGSSLIAPPLKILKGSGSPLRVLALVPCRSGAAMTLSASDMVLLPPSDRTLPRMLELQAAHYGDRRLISCGERFMELSRGARHRRRPWRELARGGRFCRRPRRDPLLQPAGDAGDHFGLRLDRRHRGPDQYRRDGTADRLLSVEQRCMPVRDRGAIRRTAGACHRRHGVAAGRSG